MLDRGISDEDGFPLPYKSSGTFQKMSALVCATFLYSVKERNLLMIAQFHSNVELTLVGKCNGLHKRRGKMLKNRK